MLLAIVFVAGMLAGFFASTIVESPESILKTTGNNAIAPNSATVHIVAVIPDPAKGIVGTATVELVPGHDRTLLNANPFIEPDTQESVAIAKAVAENYANMSLGDNDVIVTFDLPLGNDSAYLVGGPSAGAALTLAIIAAMKNQSIRTDIAITGTILPDGRIGAISGILEKAQAAGEANMSLFILPAGQSDVSYYERVERHRTANGFAITTISYVPKELVLNEFTKQWNMTSVEVSNVSEAVRYAITAKKD